MKIIKSSRKIQSDDNFRQRGFFTPTIKVGDEVVVSNDENKRGTVLEVGDDGICLVDWNPDDQNLGYINVSKLRVVNNEEVPKVINGSEEDDYELDSADQEYDSAATSINSNKLPAIYKMISIPEGSTFVDFGGGRFDNCVEYIRDKGATLCVYDPYNRSAEHNKEVLRILRENGGADGAINSNVLNVIKEPEARSAVLRNIAKITKPRAPIYITVYEGTGKGNEGPTKAGYQLNRKTQDYLEEIQEVFPDAKRKGKLITAHNSGVTAAINVNASNDPSRNLKVGEKVYWIEDGEIWRDAVGTITKIRNEKIWNTPMRVCTYYDIEWDNGDESTKIDPWNLIRVSEADKEGIFESISIESSTQYDEYMTKKYNGTEYSIHYTTIDDIPPEEDEYGTSYDRRLFNRFAGQISPIHPYDDANYQWAKFEDGGVNYYCNGKLVDIGGYWTFEDGDFEYPYEWCESIIDSIIESLDRKNKDIQPKMIHMSKNIKASSYDNISISNLQNEITNKVDEIMHRSEYFGDDDEMFTISDYYAVDVEDVEYSNYIRIEVRAEVGFDHLMEIADELNKIITKYDSDAYFDAVEPGILEAFIDSVGMTVNAADYVPDYNLEPDEPDIREKGMEALIEVILDDDITLYEEGNDITWDWADQDFTFARTPDGGKEHRTEEFDIYIADYIDVVEKVDELLSNDNRLPLIPGNYHLSGEIDLIYEIDTSYVPHMGRSEDEYYEELNNADVRYNESKSKILPGFKVERI